MSEGKAILYVAGTILLLFVGLYRYYVSQKLKRIAKNRPSLHKFEDIKKMEAQGFSYKITDEVYDAIQMRIKVENFDLYPEDDLLNLFKIDTLQAENLIDNLLDELDLVPPSEETYKQIFKENRSIVNSIYILKLLHKCKNKSDTKPVL